MTPSRSLVLAVVLVGCAGAAPSRETSPAPSPVVEGRSVAAIDAGPGDGGPPAHHVRILESTPAEEHEVGQRIPASARARLEACHSGGPGKLRVRVRSERGRLVFEAEPGSSLDPTERRCVLETLAALRRDDVASTLWSGATVPATGFTPLLTIEW